MFVCFLLLIVSFVNLRPMNGLRSYEEAKDFNRVCEIDFAVWRESLFDDYPMIFDILRSVKHPETLSVNQIERWKRANKKWTSQIWVSDVSESYQLNQHKFIDYENYLSKIDKDMVLSMDFEGFSEINRLIRFNFTYNIQREYNDRFVTNTLLYENPIKVSEPIIIFKNQSYHPLNRGYFGNWNVKGIYSSEDSILEYKYPDKNGVILKSNDLSLVFIKPVIAMDMRFVENQFLVLIYPSKLNYRITYFDREYIAFYYQYESSYLIEFLVKPNKDKMIVYKSFRDSNNVNDLCGIDEEFGLKYLSFDEFQPLIENYYKELERNMTKAVVIVTTKQDTCVKTECPKSECPNIFGEITTMQSVTQRSLLQKFSAKRKKGSKSDLVISLPTNTSKEIKRISTDKPIDNSAFEQNSEDNVLNNKTLLFQRSVHGVSFNKLANVMLFDDVWIHVIKLDFPLQNFIPKMIDNKKYCNSFVEKFNPSFDNRTLSLRDSFKIVCETFETNLLSFSKNIKETAVNSLLDFKDRQLTRSKRFIIESLIVVGIGTAVVSVGAAIGKLFYDVQNTKHDIRELNKNILILEKQAEALRINNKMLAQNFIGFSKRVDSLAKGFDKKLELLKMHILNQTTQLEVTLNKTLNYVEQTSWIHTIISTFNSYRLTQNMYLENQLNILLDSIQNYENIFQTLRDNRLPHSLVDIKMLKNILAPIQNEIKGKFEIGIDEIDYHLFYTLPLTSFIIRKNTNEIFITIKVPLKRKNTNVLYDALQPKFSPFPCLNRTCSKHQD